MRGAGGCGVRDFEGSKTLVDVPASTSTTASIGVGGTVQGTLEVGGDHDWYRINLVAGQQITISLSGTSGPGGVSDPYLNLRNSAGTIIMHNDDSGGSLNSKIVFTVTTSGTYYIDAGAWDASSLADGSNQAAPGPNAITGNYVLSVQNYTWIRAHTSQGVALDTGLLVRHYE